MPAVKLADLDAWSGYSEDLGILFLNTTLVVILGTTILATIFSFLTERDIDDKQRKDLRTRLMNDVEDSELRDLRPGYR